MRKAQILTLKVFTIFGLILYLMGCEGPAGPSLSAEKGNIEGKALLAYADDHIGIMISIYGTSYIAFTDTEGSYRISMVDPGIYTLKAEKEGYLPTEQEGVEVKAGETTEVPDLTLNVVVIESATPLIVAPGGSSTYAAVSPGACSFTAPYDFTCLAYESETLDPGVPDQYDVGIGVAWNFKPGDIITLPINANLGEEQLTSYHFWLSYDKDILTNPYASGGDPDLPPPYYTNCASSPATNFGIDPARLVWINPSASKVEPTGLRNLANITFTISPDAPAGAYPIKFEVIEFYSFFKKPDPIIPSNPINGWVIVEP